MGAASDSEVSNVLLLVCLAGTAVRSAHDAVLGLLPHLGIWKLALESCFGLQAIQPTHLLDVAASLHGHAIQAGCQCGLPGKSLLSSQHSMRAHGKAQEHAEGCCLHASQADEGEGLDV